MPGIGRMRGMGTLPLFFLLLLEAWAGFMAGVVLSTLVRMRDDRVSFHRID
jgi:hypothetical protein